MAIVFNPFTRNFDFVTKDINQIKIGDDDTYFRWVAPDTLELLVNGVVRQSWTTAYIEPAKNVYNTDGQQIFNTDGSFIFHT
jgi:hypothetical protein